MLTPFAEATLRLKITQSIDKVKYVIKIQKYINLTDSVSNFISKIKICATV